MRRKQRVEEEVEEEERKLEEGELGGQEGQGVEKVGASSLLPLVR
jgi:hypothetical protein